MDFLSDCPTEGCDCRTNSLTELNILRVLRDIVVQHTQMVEGGLDVYSADVRMMVICRDHGWFQPNLGVALDSMFRAMGL